MRNWFWLPLLLSFACNLASAFTAAFTRRLGQRGGQLLSAGLRNGLGLPLLGVAFIQAARWPAERWVAATGYTAGAAWTLLTGGVVLIGWAVAALRGRAAAPSVADALECRGPYAWMRHPLYVGVLLELAGASLARPTWPMLLSALLTAGWVLAQARAEEHDLCQRLPGYARYMTQVPRFIPRLPRR